MAIQTPSTGSEDIRKRPQEGQRLNRAPYGGYMPPGNMNRSETVTETGGGIAARAAKSGFKKALPFLIAGGSTGLATGGVLGYILFS